MSETLSNILCPACGMSFLYKQSLVGVSNWNYKCPSCKSTFEHTEHINNVCSFTGAALQQLQFKQVHSEYLDIEQAIKGE